MNPSIQFGSFSITFPVFGTFRLDGGAMFGSVPKTLWSKRIAADEENCIPLCTRSLLVKFGTETVLVDVGMGEKWNERTREIFAIKNNPLNTLGFTHSEVTTVVLTHLHFDHAGGVSLYRDSDAAKNDAAKLELSYQQALHIVQADNLSNARKPSLKERASYLKENYEILERGRCKTVNGSVEIFPNFWVHQVNGHTIGQQYIELRHGTRSILYPTDLIPTAHHISLPFTMGYDMCAATLLSEKERFLSDALERNALVVFEHDCDTVAACIGKDERGQFCATERFTHPSQISSWLAA